MGDFDMAVGKEIVSAFAGAADYRSYDVLSHTLSGIETVRVSLSEAEKKRNQLYQKVREQRESNAIDLPALTSIFKILSQEFPED